MMLNILTITIEYNEIFALTIENNKLANSKYVFTIWYPNSQNDKNKRTWS